MTDSKIALFTSARRQFGVAYHDVAKLIQDSTMRSLDL